MGDFGWAGWDFQPKKRMESVDISTDPYQSVNKWNVEAEPFDFASQGREVAELLDAGAARKSRQWSTPQPQEPQFSQSYQAPKPYEFSFENSWNAVPNMRLPGKAGEFQSGVVDDDLVADLLGSGIEAERTSYDPVDWATKTGTGLYEKFKERGLPRTMGSIAGSIPEELKAGLLGGKAALLGGKAALAAKGAGGGAASMAALVPPDQARRVIAALGLTRAEDAGTRKLLDLTEHHLGPSTADMTDIGKFLRTGNEGLLLESTGTRPSYTALQELESLAKVHAGMSDAEKADAVNDYLATLTGKLPPKRNTPRTGPGEAALPTAYGYGGYPGMRSIMQSQEVHPLIINPNDPGISAKRMTEGSDRRRWMHKGSSSRTRRPNESITDAIARSDVEDAAQEEMGSHVASLLTGMTPRAHVVKEGGSIQPWLEGDYRLWGHMSPQQQNALIPDLAPDLARSHVADTIAQTEDLHPEQFMIDEANKRLIGIDKGSGKIERSFQNYGGRRGGWIPEDYIYGETLLGGRFARHMDPAVYQETARKAASWDEPTVRSILHPLMKNKRWSQADQDTKVRSFLQYLQDVPDQFDQFYRYSVNP